MDQAMGAAMTLSSPTEQVDALIQQVAEENGLEVIDQLKDLKAPAASVASTSKSHEQEREDDLSRRWVYNRGRGLA
jgi:charged multivesicular body protein 1